MRIMDPVVPFLLLYPAVDRFLLEAPGVADLKGRDAAGLGVEVDCLPVKSQVFSDFVSGHYDFVPLHLYPVRN